MVESLRKFIRNQNRRSSVETELEIRFGQMEESSWVRLLGSLELFTKWTKVHEWKESTDFFYYAENLGNVRTTRTTDENGKLVIYHLKKQKLEDLQLILNNCRIFDHAKLTLSTEETIADENLPDGGADTTMVRIKHRKTFIWNDWIFDITKSWGAPTFSEALKKKDANKNTSFEFEIEMINPTKVFAKSDYTNEFITACIILRIVGIVPEQSCTIKTHS